MWCEVNCHISELNNKIILKDMEEKFRNVNLCFVDFIGKSSFHSNKEIFTFSFKHNF